MRGSRFTTGEVPEGLPAGIAAVGGIAGWAGSGADIATGRIGAWRASTTTVGATILPGSTAATCSHRSAAREMDEGAGCCYGNVD